MKIIDTYQSIATAYENGKFDFKKWKSYINAALPDISRMLIEDSERCLKAGADWEKDFLPVLDAVMQDDELRERAHASFCNVCKNLERTVYEKFEKELDVVIIFYLGLCNGAGWVTKYKGQSAILLGIEKIIELNWCSPDDMYGLIYHELGHVYQGAYGVLDREFENSADTFLWKLFPEGIAMCFEHILVGDSNYYLLDKNGWKSWCDKHFEEIKKDFDHDLKAMTHADQRYFGDWVKYRGHGDVGYYLGCRFVRYILSAYKFDDILSFDINTVTKLYKQFMQ